MADINISQGQSVPMTMHTRYVDMGDGTHAQMLAVALAPAGAIAVTGPLTDAELRATAVPVSGPLTDTELRNTSVPTTPDAQEVHLGQVGGEGATPTQIPTITAGIYADGQVVGGLLTFANMARVAGSGGILTQVLIVDDAGQDATLELWLFNQTFTAIADQGAWAPSEADLENCIGVISTAESSMGWRDAGTPSVIDIEVTKRIDLIGTSLFGQLVNRTTTPTYAATDDITVKVPALQD